jgi:hypothetical protein
MSKRPWLVFVGIALFILIVGLACSAGGSASTAEPVATDAPKSMPTAEPKPTSEPQQTLPTQSSAPAGAAPFEMDTAVYTHPSGAFSFNPPVGWTSEESKSGVVFTSPDGVGKLDFSATNTGEQLDSKALEAFVKATEANFFGTFSNYKQTQYQFDPSTNSAMVSKTLTSDSGDRKVFTYYLQDGQGVYSFDFWVNADQSSAYKDPYANLLGTITTDGKAAAKLPIYSFINTFTDKNKLFQFDVPLAWTYTYDEAKNIYSDTFTSPDGHSIINNITYDDGTATSKSQAGALALTMLNQVFSNGANDIKINSDKVQPDGSERLTWSSISGGYSGQSFFETRGTTFLMLSWLVDKGYSDMFGPVLDNTLSSYKIP